MPCGSRSPSACSRASEGWPDARQDVAVIARVIAAHFGPSVGGLFLALPAIFCASATLVEPRQAKSRPLRRQARSASGCTGSSRRGIGEHWLDRLRRRVLRSRHDKRRRCLHRGPARLGRRLSFGLVAATEAADRAWSPPLFHASASRGRTGSPSLVVTGNRTSRRPPEAARSGRRSRHAVVRQESLPARAPAEASAPLLECVGLSTFSHLTSSVVEGPGCWPSDPGVR